MRNTSKSFFLIALFCVFCSNSLVANAVYLEKFDRPIVDVFNDLAKFLLSIAGGIALLVIIIAGVYYITSTGSSERQEKAKKMMRNCLFGLIFALASYGMIVTISKITTNKTISITGASVVPISGPPGTVFTIKATITAPAGVSPATTIAYIQSPDETIAPCAPPKTCDSVLLVDNGVAPDLAAGDDIYTGEWTSIAAGAYFVDINACDIAGNCAEAENI